MKEIILLSSTRRFGIWSEFTTRHTLHINVRCYGNSNYAYLKKTVITAQSYHFSNYHVCKRQPDSWQVQKRALLIWYIVFWTNLSLAASVSNYRELGFPSFVPQGPHLFLQVAFYPFTAKNYTKNILRQKKDFLRKKWQKKCQCTSNVIAERPNLYLSSSIYSRLNLKTFKVFYTIYTLICFQAFTED